VVQICVAVKRIPLFLGVSSKIPNISDKKNVEKPFVNPLEIELPLQGGNWKFIILKVPQAVPARFSVKDRLGRVNLTWIIFIQLLSHSKHFPDRGNRSANAAREIIIYFAAHTAHPNALRMQNVELLNVDLVLRRPLGLKGFVWNHKNWI
jgi:hypothetical protein